MARDGGRQPDLEKATTGLTVSLDITNHSQQLIRQQLIADWNSCPMSDLRLRYELLDLAYYMESDEHLKQTNASRIITTLYKELELPILQPNIDAAHAYLAGIFTSDVPIFGVVTKDIEQDEVAQQMESVIEENSKATGWARHISLALKDGLKYNLGSFDIDWNQRESFNFITDTEISFKQAIAANVIREGNEVTSNNMYNLAFDTSVPPAEVALKGDFTIKVERMTLMRLHELVSELGLRDGTVMNINAQLWESSPFHNFYYTPSILSSNTVYTGVDWVQFFAGIGSRTSMRQNALDKFEVIRYNRKIIPSMYGITAPDKDKVQIWRFIEVNGIIIYAERRTNAHKMLPTIIFQPVEDKLGLQTKGLGQNLLPYQKQAGTMYRARVASLARSLSDRMIFDPSRISAKDINSQNPAAKIPVRPKGYGSKISDSVQHIPYDDRNAQSLYNDIAHIDARASEIAHVNKAQRGQFVKGNKTQDEFNEIMSNADAPQQMMALLLEHQAFIPLKLQIKINILQYQGPATLTNPSTNKAVQVDPVQLRSAIINFTLSDGLVDKTSLMNTEQTIQAFQFFAQIPEASNEYDLIGMMSDSMAHAGSNHKKYRRPEEERQQRVKEQNSQPVTVDESTGEVIP